MVREGLASNIDAEVAQRQKHPISGTQDHIVTWNATGTHGVSERTSCDDESLDSRMSYGASAGYAGRCAEHSTA